MALRVVQFFAVVLTALALAPAVAHLASLLNKINLTAEQYFIVQSSYRGWFLFALAQIPSVIVAFVLAFMLRGDPLRFRFALVGAVCMAATLAIYFAWVNPANLATDQWTIIPENWETLRRHWEYGHAASAAFNIVALCAIAAAVVTSRE
ncbi:MAG: DUF1772 domain-containing protein [Rhizobiales bacterium]|nr:DUF1772 domain-containing protein [Hyphomicrobiales bacterium]